jgi:5'-nucleotidase
MRFSAINALTALLGLVSTSDALKILMGNDDGFGSGNLRELYKLLVNAGHEGKRHHRRGHNLPGATITTVN